MRKFLTIAASLVFAASSLFGAEITNKLDVILSKKILITDANGSNAVNVRDTLTNDTARIVALEVGGASALSNVVVNGVSGAISGSGGNRVSTVTLTPGNIGAVSTNDARYLAALTNGALYATAAQGLTADAAAVTNAALMSTQVVVKAALSGFTNSVNALGSTQIVVKAALDGFTNQINSIGTSLSGFTNSVSSIGTALSGFTNSVNALGFTQIVVSAALSGFTNSVNALGATQIVNTARIITNSQNIGVLATTQTNVINAISSMSNTIVNATNGLWVAVTNLNTTATNNLMTVSVPTMIGASNASIVTALSGFTNSVNALGSTQIVVKAALDGFTNSVSSIGTALSGFTNSVNALGFTQIVNTARIGTNESAIVATSNAIPIIVASVAATGTYYRAMLADTVTGVQSGLVANAAAHTNRTDNPHVVTAVQVGGVTTNQLNAATNPIPGWITSATTGLATASSVVEASTNLYATIVAATNPIPSWITSATTGLATASSVTIASTNLYATIIAATNGITASQVGAVSNTIIGIATAGGLTNGIINNVTGTVVNGLATWTIAASGSGATDTNYFRNSVNLTNRSAVAFSDWGGATNPITITSTVKDFANESTLITLQGGNNDYITIKNNASGGGLLLEGGSNFSSGASIILCGKNNGDGLPGGMQFQLGLSSLPPVSPLNQYVFQDSQGGIMHTMRSVDHLGTWYDVNNVAKMVFSNSVGVGNAWLSIGGAVPLANLDVQGTALIRGNTIITGSLVVSNTISGNGSGLTNLTLVLPSHVVTQNEANVILTGPVSVTNGTVATTVIPAAPSATGTGTTLLGNGAGVSLTSGANNTLIGVQAGPLLASTSHNTMIGQLAGYSLFGDVARENTFIGQSAGYSMTNGRENILIGRNAGQYIAACSSNVCVGNYAGQANNGQENVNIGYKSGSYYGGSVVTNNSYQNTYVGAFSGESSISGSRNIFIGYAAGKNESGSDLLYIANSSTAMPLIYGNFALSTLMFYGMASATGNASNGTQLVNYQTLTNQGAVYATATQGITATNAYMIATNALTQAQTAQTTANQGLTNLNSTIVAATNPIPSWITSAAVSSSNYTASSLSSATNYFTNLVFVTSNALQSSINVLSTNTVTPAQLVSATNTLATNTFSLVFRTNLTMTTIGNITYVDANSQTAGLATASSVTVASTNLQATIVAATNPIPGWITSATTGLATASSVTVASTNLNATIIAATNPIPGWITSATSAVPATIGSILATGSIYQASTVTGVQSGLVASAIQPGGDGSSVIALASINTQTLNVIGAGTIAVNGLYTWNSSSNKWLKGDGYMINYVFPGPTYYLTLNFGIPLYASTNGILGVWYKATGNNPVPLVLGLPVTNTLSQICTNIYFLQTGKVDLNGNYAISLGTGTADDLYSIVTGYGQISHGVGSVTAGGGFWGDGSQLTGITPSQIGAATSDQGIVATNAYMIATNAQSIANSPSLVPTVFTSITGGSLTLSNLQYVVFSTGNTTITLPSATLNPGRSYRIKKMDGPPTTLTVNTVAGLIDGNSSLSITVQYTAIDLVSDGSNWGIF